MKHWKLALVTLLALIAALALGAACAEAAELIYTPGEDLLLAEWEGVKIWLPGEQTDEYGEDCFFRFWPGDDDGGWIQFFLLGIDNETEQEYKIVCSGEIDGYAMRLEGEGWLDYSSSNSNTAFLIEGEPADMAEANGLSASEVENIINNAKVVTLDLGIRQNAPWISETAMTSVHDFDPIVIRFQSEAPADTETAEAVEAEAPEQTDGPGEVHKDKATVKAAQQALNKAGYDCGTPDGVAGKKTKSAISNYQTDKGLTVTGTVTDELLASLGLN